MSQSPGYTDSETVDRPKSLILESQLNLRVKDRANDVKIDLGDQSETRRAEKVIPTQFDGNILNVRPDPPDFRDKVYESSLQEIKSYMVPDLKVDSRTGEISYEGVSVRDQGSEGSCTGQALAAVVDFQNLRRKADGANVPKSVSSRMLYEEARGYDEFPDDDLPGSSIRGAIKAFYHRGACDSALAPYFPGDLDYELSVDIAKDARRVTLGAYYRLRHILNDYHSALTAVQAIFCSAMLHDGWTEENVRKNNGRIVRPNDNNYSPRGAHAFTIIGYDSEGFLVLNSWGERWGNLDTATLSGGACKSCEHTLPGVAHWSYEDWQENVLDAWVLRLQAPTGKISGFSGGYRKASDDDRTTASQRRRPSLPSVPSSKIIGHYIHIDDGRLVTKKPWSNNLKTFEHTAEFLLKQDDIENDAWRYDNLLFYAHGGLQSLEASSALAAQWTDRLKKNGIYPIFYLWNTGIKNTTFDILERYFEQALERTGSISGLMDNILEKMIRPVAKPLWSEMKLDANMAMNIDEDPNIGQAWDATKILFDAARKRKKNPLKVHFIGFSAGTILLAELIKRVQQDKYPLEEIITTLNLWGPATTWELFDKTYNRLAKKMPQDKFSIYNLSDHDERNDGIKGLYQKSILYLVSRALERKPDTHIVGMDKFWSGAGNSKSSKIRYVISNKTAALDPDKQFASTSRSHSFDDDGRTFNDVLYAILGRKPKFPFEE